MRQNASLVAITATLVVLARASSFAQAPFAVTWGYESSGELGNGLPLSGLSFPGPVSNASGGCCLGQMVDIQGADDHSLGLDNARRVWAWGSNAAGQLGLGTLSIPNSAIPVQVPSLIGRLPAAPEQETIAAEGGHSLVVDGTGAVWAWGFNDRGQLGIGNPGTPTCGTAPNVYPCRTSPVQVALANVVGVGAGERHSLAVVGDCTNGPGDAYAWGANGSGQLGDTTTTDRFTPVQVHGPLNSGFLSGVAKMVGGEGHTVALMCNGDVMAWGQNDQGQLGSGNTTNGLVPALVVTPCPLPPRPLLGCPLTNVIDIAAGFEHSLAVDANGDVWFWGDNASGQLCNGATTDLVFATKVLSGALTAAPPPPLPRDVVAGGVGFSLVLLAGNTLVGCGLNGLGQLGDCTTTDSSTPVPVRQSPSCSAPYPGVLLVEAGENRGLMLTDISAPTATATATSPRPPTPTATRTSTPTLTRTVTRTPTRTATAFFTATRTPTPTPTATCAFDITGPRTVTISTGSQVWSLIAAPPGTTGFSSPGPATVIASNAAWTTLPNTQWISANPGCTNTTTTDCPGGLYSYQLCWEQCGPLAFSPLLQILADDTATVSLDGNPLTTIPTPPPIGSATPATILGFTPGTGLHTLQVDVYNTPDSLGGGTATGMDLSGILNGYVRIVPCAVTPPAFTATHTPTASRTRTPTSSPTATPPACDLAVSKSISPKTAGSGDRVTVFVTVTNVGTGSCAPGIIGSSVADFGSADLVLSPPVVLNPPLPGWTCFVFPPSSPLGNEFGCFTLLQLPQGYTVTFSFSAQVTAPAFTSVQNCAQGGNPNDLDQTNDRSCASIRVVPFVVQLAVDVSATATTIRVDDVSQFPTTGIIQVDGELMSYNGTQPDAAEVLGADAAPRAGVLLDVLRGVNGTVATTHTGGATVALATPACGGDCNGSNDVTVDELLSMVNIALGGADVNTCVAGDVGHDGAITVDEILMAVDHVLTGCPAR